MVKNDRTFLNELNRLLQTMQQQVDLYGDFNIVFAPYQAPKGCSEDEKAYARIVTIWSGKPVSVADMIKRLSMLIT